MMAVPTTRLRKWLLFSVLCTLILQHNCKIAEASSAAGQETLVGVVGRDFVMLGADSSVSQSIALTASNLDKIAVLVDPLTTKEEASEQQTIVAAAAGDAADADRLIGLLSAHCAICEFEAGVGCDVQVLDLEKDNSKDASPPGLSVTAVAHLARGQIASSLRSQQHFKVCLLIAGMVPSHGEKLEGTSSTSTFDKVGHFVSKQVQWQVETASQEFRPLDANKKKLLPTKHADESKLLEPRLFWLDEYGSLQKLKYGAHGFGANFCLSILDQGYHPNLTRKEAEDLIRECFNQLRTRYVINSPQPPCIKCVDAQGCQLIT